MTGNDRTPLPRDPAGSGETFPPSKTRRMQDIAFRNALTAAFLAGLEPSGAPGPAPRSTEPKVLLRPVATAFLPRASMIDNL